MYNKIFFENVQKALDELGMSKTDLAVKADISPSYISELMNETGNPSLNKMEAIASALGVPLTELLSSTSTDLEIKESSSQIKGYCRVSAILTVFQGFQVKNWHSQNIQTIKSINKRRRNR